MSPPAAASPSSSDGLLALLRDAAIQRRFMRGRIADRRFGDDGGQTLYAVDMDVIRMYASPRNDNSTLHGRIPYGRVFESDSDDVAEALARRLVDHIFFKLSGPRPLMVIPPIEDEFERYLRQLMSEFGLKPRSRYIDEAQMDQLLAKLDLPADEAHREALSAASRKMHELLHIERGLEGAFRRVDQLLRDGRVAGPDADDFKAQLNDPIIARALQPFSLDPAIRHYELTQEWIKRLNQVGHKGRPAENDAVALARLEIWNEQLAPHRRRIVYITGSRTLFQAAWAYRPFGSETFGDLYLRHPRAFIDAPGVLKTGERPGWLDATLPGATPEGAEGGLEGGEFTKLLMTFLGAFPSSEEALLERNFDLASHARVVALRTLEQQPDLGTKFLHEWSTFTAEMDSDYRPPKAVEERLVEMFRTGGGPLDAYGRWRTVEARIHGLLEAGVRDAWDLCFRMATRTGFAFALNDYAEAPRTVPPLNFDSWKATHAIIDKVSRWHSSKQVDFDAYDAGLRAVEKDDNTGYAHYLVHAALFAGRGIWDVAAVLADKAANLTPPGPRVPGRANGREAVYLLSVCRRHTAKRLQDLDGLEALVDLAIRIHKEEAGVRAIEAIPERFRGEKLAIELTRLMFERFPPGEDPEILPSEDWRAAREDLVVRLAKLSEDTVLRLETARDRATSDDDPAAAKLARTLAKLDLRTQTNILSLLLVDAEDADLREDPRFRDAAARMTAYVPAREDGPDVSYFVRIVVSCVNYILEPDLRKRRDMRNAAVQDLNAKKIQTNAVFPYDIARLEQFREAVFGL